MRLDEIAPDRYAREVLPLTAELWAGRRTFEEYAAQTLEVARGAYGRRCYRTIGLYDGGTLVASFKRYEREIRLQDESLRAIGFGAVYTPPEYRGRGYASVMVAAELDRARAQGYDLGYLFSDIRPQFYEELGFRTLASRRMTLRADSLPAQRIHPTPLRSEDWSSVRRCFEAGERRRESAMMRGSAVWGWIALRARHGSEHSLGRVCNLALRTSRGVRAYVLGARVPERDAYALDEFGFANEAGMAQIPALLRAAAGDLRRITGWVPPGDLRALLPPASTRSRTRSILMGAPLSASGRALLAAAATQKGDFCWATDHI